MRAGAYSGHSQGCHHSTGRDAPLGLAGLPSQCGQGHTARTDRGAPPVRAGLFSGDLTCRHHSTGRGAPLGLAVVPTQRGRDYSAGTRGDVDTVRAVFHSQHWQGRTARAGGVAITARAGIPCPTPHTRHPRSVRAPRAAPCLASSSCRATPQYRTVRNHHAGQQLHHCRCCAVRASGSVTLHSAGQHLHHCRCWNVGTSGSVIFYNAGQQLAAVALEDSATLPLCCLTMPDSSYGSAHAEP